MCPRGHRLSIDGSAVVSERLARRTAVVGAMTVVSRVLGLARDVIIARAFGAAAAADAFFVAFRVPNLFRRWFGEGAFSQAFVPVLSEYRERYQRSEVEALVAAVSGTLAAGLVAFTLAGIAAAPALVALFSPGFVGEPEQFARTVALLRLTFPYLTLVSLVALAGGVLNTYGVFAVPAFTPVFLNVGLIAGALVVAPHLAEPIYALAYGVLAGGVLQLAFQLPALARIGMLCVPRLVPGHAGVRQILGLMAPAVFGASVAQLNILIDTALASTLVAGSISWLYYADRMMEFPLGVFSIALGTVVLPTLSRAFQRADDGGYAATLDWALKLVALVTLPAAVGLAVLSMPILTTLFQYGRMTPEDVRAAADALAAYGIGLVALSAVKVLAPAYFARQDTRTPVRVGLVAVVVNVVLNLALIGPLAHVGLALATSIAAVVNAGLLLRGLLIAGRYAPQPGWRHLAFAIAAGLMAMTIVLVVVTPPLEVWAAAGAPGRGIRLALTILAGASAYLATVTLAGVRLRELARV